MRTWRQFHSNSLDHIIKLGVGLGKGLEHDELNTAELLASEVLLGCLKSHLGQNCTIDLWAWVDKEVC